MKSKNFRGATTSPYVMRPTKKKPSPKHFDHHFDKVYEEATRDNETLDSMRDIFQAWHDARIKREKIMTNAREVVKTLIDNKEPMIKDIEKTVGHAVSSLNIQEQMSIAHYSTEILATMKVETINGRHFKFAYRMELEESESFCTVSNLAKNAYLEIVENLSAIMAKKLHEECGDSLFLRWHEPRFSTMSDPLVGIALSDPRAIARAVSA